jgi:hypothetical protein
MPDRVLDPRMDIGLEPMVERYDHLDPILRAGEASLAVTEGRPRRALHRGELYVVEGKLSSEGLPPTIDEEGEEYFVRLDVVRIRLPLVPECPTEGKALEWADARVIEIGGGIGVTSKRCVTSLEVLPSTLSHPRHDEVIRSPMTEDGWELHL